MTIGTKMIKPLNPHLAAVWEADGCEYPATIRVPMEDGKIITYERRTEQPHPKCLKSIELIRIMKECTYGGYPAKHNKKTGERANTQPASQKNNRK